MHAHRLAFVTDEMETECPASIREISADIESGNIRSYTEPYQGFWLTMDGALNREVISLILAASGTLTTLPRCGRCFHFA